MACRKVGGWQRELLAAALCVLAPEGIRAQSGATLQCSSVNGGRTFCTADTRGGVRLMQQESRASCVKGSTWDFDTRGVWVDRGCGGEFQLGDGPGNLAPMRGSLAQPDLRSSNSPRGSLAAGTAISVRTNERIDTGKLDGRVFSGVVDRDVVDGNGNVVIPGGSDAELLIRSASNREMVLDLDLIVVNGQRYSVATSDIVETQQLDGVGGNKRTAKFVGGGALLGTVIGAIAGGGKGAAIGAAAGAGAGAGAQLLTRGRTIRVPAESILAFRLEQTLQVGGIDRGFKRRGRHYHQ